MFKSSNPLLSRMDNDVQMLEGAPMTVSGTITKTFILLLIAAVSAAAVVYEAFMGYADKVMMIMGIALFAGLGTGLVTAFVPKLAKFLAPVYAFAQGALLAALSLIMETQFPGIAMQAVAATFFTFFSVIVVLVAALSLILDFDFIEQGAQKMLPKDYEWYGSFGLLVTLVWLYVEILRLLSRLRND